AIDQALKQKNKAGNTALHILAHKQDQQILRLLKALIQNPEHINPRSLYDALNEKDAQGKSVIDLLLQTPLATDTEFPHELSQFLFLHAPITDNHERLLTQLRSHHYKPDAEAIKEKIHQIKKTPKLEASAPEILSTLEEAFDSNDDNAKTNCILKYFDNTAPHQAKTPLHNFMRSLFLTLPKTAAELALEYRNLDPSFLITLQSLTDDDPNFIYTASWKALVCSDLAEENLEQLINNIREYGLCTWHDVYKLRNKANPAINQALDRWLAADGVGLFENNSEIRERLFTHSYSAKQVTTMWQQTQLVAKTFIDENRWKQHLRSLADPNQRIAGLRAKPASNATHKFHHKSGDIRPYSKKEKVIKPHYQYTQKVSATLLSGTGKTTLFGSQHDFPLVGLLYRAEPERDAAWLSADKGTYHHGWIGSEASVKQYQNAMTNINYTDYDAFMQKINTAESNRPNEILSRFNMNRVVGIVVGKNDFASRQLAIQRQKEVQETLGLDLPIIIYIPSEKRFEEYTSLMQKEDLISERIKRPYSIAKEINAKSKLLALKKQIESDIKETTPQGTFNFFQKKTIYTGNLNERAAEQIPRIIEHAEAAEQENYQGGLFSRHQNITWCEAEAAVDKYLKQSTPKEKAQETKTGSSTMR
ncbi:MAG: hypothetical protein KDH94_04485, partial [Coxiellaceae bacterium]|nr:hypothetical protein [Coxiellaceae bacterium]